jgi:MinD superfamily P-loop ATPase
MIKIAIASGKGGTGKTFVATNIFHVLTQKNVSSVLADCDAEAPNALSFFRTDAGEAHEVVQYVPVIDVSKCTYCGKCHEYCNYNAIFILPPSEIISVIEDLCHGCGACSVACEYDAITEKPFPLGNVNIHLYNNLYPVIEARMNTGIMSPVRVIKQALRHISHEAEIVILDSPPGTSCPFIQTVNQADYVILVTEPTPFGLSDLRQSVETLKTMNRQYGVIINKAGTGYNDVREYLEREGIALLLEIPYSRKIAGLYSTGRLPAESDESFGKQLLNVIENITVSYGNSNNKR